MNFRKFLLISLFCVSFVFAGDKFHTISLGIGKIVESDIIGGSYVVPFKYNYLIEDRRSGLGLDLKYGLFIGYENFAFKALDGNNISRTTSLSLIDFGAMFKVFNIKYAYIKWGFSLIMDGEMSGVSATSSNGLLYGGINFFMDIEPILIEFEVDKYFVMDKLVFGEASKTNHRTIFLEKRLLLSIHYIFHED